MVIPTILSFADTAETSAIWYLLKHYPEQYPKLETVMMIATPFKWFMGLTAVLVFVNGYVVNWYLKQK